MPATEQTARGVAWTIRGLILALTLIALVQTRWMVAANTGVMLAFAVAAPVVTHFTRYRVPSVLDALVAAAASTHALGHFFDWYRTVWGYDNLLHLGVSIAVAFLVYLVVIGWLDALDAHRSRDGVTKIMVGLFVIAVTALAGVLWELVEFGLDQVLGTNAQRGLADTNVDLLFDALGGAIMAVIGPHLDTHDGVLGDAEQTMERNVERAQHPEG